MLLNLLIVISFISPFEESSLKKQPLEEPKTPYQTASLWLLALHQNYLTHIDGPRSHFIPCSSTYMKQAILKYGFFKGSLLGLDRLLRENKDPWVYETVIRQEDKIKYDPVP